MNQENKWSRAKVARTLGRFAEPPIPGDLKARLLAQCPARPSFFRRHPFVLGGAAAAAAACIVVTILLVHCLRSAQETGGQMEEQTAAQVQQAIENEARAVRLLATASALQDNPAMREEMDQVRDYAIRQYADTTVVKEFQMHRQSRQQGDIQ